MGFAIANDLIAEFERWALSAGFDISKNGIVYNNTKTTAALVGFSAGRDRHSNDGWIPVKRSPSGIVSNNLPADGQDVEAIVDFGGAVDESECRFQIVRTKLFSSRVFACEAASSGAVTHWRPASPTPTASASDYAGLNNLIAE